MLITFAFLGTQEILILGALVLILFGGAKIPQLMRGLGRGMGEFQTGINEGKKSFEDSMKGKFSDDDVEHKTMPSEPEVEAKK